MEDIQNEKKPFLKRRYNPKQEVGKDCINIFNPFGTLVTYSVLPTKLICSIKIY